MHSSGEITQLLAAWACGDREALSQLMPLVYGELHRIARRHWSGEREDHSLQPTALIHEAFLKIVGAADSGDDRRGYQSRNHFFAVASTAMRQVLVNHAESRTAQKRGSGQVMVSISGIADPAVQTEAEEVLTLHAALLKLEKIDPRKSRVVELRYFGGLSIEETAEAMGVSAITVTREWRAARAWLALELRP